MVKSVLVKLLTVKAAAAAIAVTAVGGGLAYAAGSGALPGLGTDNAPSQAAAHATRGPGAAPGSAAPSPSMVGLCRAYTAAVADSPGKALENPAFAALITAAGGSDKVGDYCTGVLADQPGAPTAIPGMRPTSVPGNAPATRPTPKPTPSHPTAPTTGPHIGPTGPAS